MRIASRPGWLPLTRMKCFIVSIRIFDRPCALSLVFGFTRQLPFCQVEGPILQVLNSYVAKKRSFGADKCSVDASVEK